MIVRKFPRRSLLACLTAALLLASCSGGATPAPTLDVNAINTAAVATAMGQLSAQFTQTALAAPTNTPVPLPTFSTPAAGSTVISFDASPTSGIPGTTVAGFTPIASPVGPAAATSALGDACNNNQFISDVTIPDGTVLKPGEDFQKVWAVKNTGTCTWDEGYTLVFIAGDKAIDPYNVKFKDSNDFVASGITANLGVRLTAPLAVGKYQGHWRMQNDKGYYFGTVLSVYFEVKKP